MKIWVNGALGDEHDARISPVDHGLLVGDGVFETLRVYGGRPFAWTRHLDRLARSARGLGLQLPTVDTLRAASETVLAAEAIEEGRLRITVTGGPAPLGSERGAAGPTTIVATSALTPWPPTARVRVVEWRRNEHGATTGLKTISYAENVRALADAHAHDADEAVFANTSGDLCEATGSNVFVVNDGVLQTPPESSGCLLGVTRALVLELAAAAEQPLEERPLPIDALRSCEEAFLSSTTREVQSIATVDGIALGSAPGPVTARLAAAFRALVAANIDP